MNNSSLKKISLQILLIAWISEYISMYILKILPLSEVNEHFIVIINSTISCTLIFIQIWFFVIRKDRKLFRNELEKENLAKWFYKKRFHAINDNFILSITDNKGTIIEANDNFLKISGYSRDDLIGKNHNIVNSSYHAKDFFKNFWISILNKKVWHGKIKNKRKDGSYYWVDSTIIPIISKDRQIEEILSVRIDITNEVELEEKLILEKKRNFDLMRLASIGEVVGGMANEINNPATIIVSKLEKVRSLILEGNINEEILFSEFNKIEIAIKRITNLIISLRLMIEPPEKEFLAHLKVSKLLEDVQSLVQEKLNTFNIKFQINNQCDNIEIYCHKKQMINALLNLILNSIDAIKNQLVRWIKIEVNKSTEEIILISIIDSGNGIEPILVEKMFQPFFTTKEVDNCIGLGLSIAKGIITSHGGDLKYELYNKNSCFVIDLPIKMN